MATRNEYDYRRRDPQFLSRPMKVVWAGWETTTHRLQQCGWMLAVEHDMFHDRYRLLMKHEAMHLTALSRFTELDTCNVRSAHIFNSDHFAAFEVQAVGHALHINIMDTGFTNFKQIDAEPQISFDHVRDVDDMGIFKIPLQRGEEIVIDKADMSVIEHLQAIKDMQKSKQAEIRDRVRREGQRENANVKQEHEVVANLIAFPGAA